MHDKVHPNCQYVTRDVIKEKTAVLWGKFWETLIGRGRHKKRGHRFRCPQPREDPDAGLISHGLLKILGLTSHSQGLQSRQPTYQFFGLL